MTVHRISKLEPQDDGFAVDADDLARALGLVSTEVHEMMRRGEIVTRFERGEGSDSGRSRLSFRHGRRQLRLTVDAQGTVLFQSRMDLA